MGGQLVEPAGARARYTVGGGASTETNIDFFFPSPSAPRWPSRPTDFQKFGRASEPESAERHVVFGGVLADGLCTHKFGSVAVIYCEISEGIITLILVSVVTLFNCRRCNKDASINVRTNKSWRQAPGWRPFVAREKSYDSCLMSQSIISIVISGLYALHLRYYLSASH